MDSTAIERAVLDVSWITVTLETTFCVILPRKVIELKLFETNMSFLIFLPLVGLVFHSLLSDNLKERYCRVGVICKRR